MRRILALVGAAALIAGACAAKSPPTTTGAQTTVAPDLAALFAEPDVDVHWRRLLRGITVLGETPRPLAAEIELLDAAITDIPQPILDMADVRSLIRTDTPPSDVREAAVAFAQGRDIYVSAATFHGPSRSDLTRVLIHELTHVAQFSRLDDAYLEAAAGAGLTLIDVAAASSMVEDFATSVGWVNRSIGSLQPSWTIDDAAAAGTTAYGRSSPEEDQAEAVSLVVTGRAGEISPNRVEWVEEWLSMSAEESSAGFPWIPPAAEQVELDTDVYDQEATRLLAVRHLEPSYWALREADGPLEFVAGEVAARLRLRGYSGLLFADDTDRYNGRFTRGDGFTLWVELHDLRRNEEAAADLGNELLLVYVSAW
ncbi:MAG: DUF4157 domain-containing protein [Acidimicrobiia bacterium]